MVVKRVIHKFAVDGVKIVLDVCSGAVHIVDDLAWKMLDDYQEMTASQLIEKYSRQFSPGEVASGLDEINELVREGLLYSQDPFPDGYQMPQRKGVKALCLNIAHLCNLKCRYCFAGQGKFGGDAQLMPLEVGQAALDSLIKDSGSYRMLQVDFFGGEPLLNFKVLKELVYYGMRKAQAAGKEINFTVTTNAVLLNKEVEVFLNENNIYVILSIDGRPEVHDRMRPGPGSTSSYSTVLENITRFVESRGGNNYYLRGTYTRFNLDFSSDIKHFVDKGFRYLSLEPVVASETEAYALTFEDLPMLMNQYEQVVRLIINVNRAGQEINFFHFNIDLEGGPCLLKRISACGAGCEYLAVSDRKSVV